MRRLETAGGRIGVVAALAEEMAPLARRLSRPHRERLDDLEIQRGELNGRAVCLAVTGEGRVRAAGAVGTLLEREPLTGLVGIGVAGGLTDELDLGELIWSRCVREAAGVAWVQHEPAWAADALVEAGLRDGTVVTVDKILTTPAAKRGLASELGIEGRAVADLESAAWVSAATGRGLPWMILRAVSDGVDEELPMDFERFRSADGSISRSRVLAHAALRPKLMLELDRLRRRVNSCATSLADAVERLME